MVYVITPNEKHSTVINANYVSTYVVEYGIGSKDYLEKSLS